VGLHGQQAVVALGDSVATTKSSGRAAAVRSCS